MKVIFSQKERYQKYEADIDWAEVAIRFGLQPEECQRRWYVASDLCIKNMCTLEF
jgi:hypothetical protein